jgi:hypothetical protein
MVLGAAMVRVEVAELAFGVTEDSDNPQAGIGDGPLTAQESSTALSQAPLTGAIVITSVTCPPACNLKLPVAGVIASWSRWANLKILGEFEINPFVAPVVKRRLGRDFQ